MRKPSPGRLAWILAATSGAAFIVWVWIDASRALRQSTDSIASEHEIRFTRLPLAGNPPAGFTPISPHRSFTSALVNESGITVSGPGGLFVYDRQGREIAAHRAGMELPSAAPGPIVQATLSDAPDPEYLIGTDGAGLLSFDGRTFRQYLPENPLCRKVTSLLPVGSGKALIGTPKCGVLAFDGRRLSVYHPALRQVYVTALAGTEESLWIGTLERGVLHWRGGRLRSFDDKQGLPDNQVLSLAVSGDRAFVGTPFGVAEFADGRFRRLLAEGFFAQSLLIRNGALAIGSLDEGVSEITLDATARHARPRVVELPARISQLLEADGRLTAVTDSGLYQVDPAGGGWVALIEPKGVLLADRNISAIAIDPAGRPWIGYFDRGLEIVESDLSRSTRVENDNVFCVNRIVHRRDGGTAVATANGLVLFDVSGRIRQVLGRADGLLADHVTDVLPQPDGFIAATPAGLTILDESGAHSIYAFHGLVNNHVYALGARDGRILAGTLGGLSIIESGIVRASYTTSNSALKHNWISALAEADGEWFAGTYGAGVFKLGATGIWEALGAPFEVNPLAMLVTPSRLYVGTLDRGLQVYDRASGLWSRVARGLPSANVTAIAEARGQIYIGTDNGLVRVSEREILR